MNQRDEDSLFAGSIPELYDRYLVPLFFEPYAVDLSARAARRAPSRVLELAAGTGVVTRHLARLLPQATELIATDLNQPMLERAAAIGTARPVTWQQADAQRLPFDDTSFDLVVCQFGVMFFPDKVKAFGEARRVLRAGGAYLFNVWDRIDENEFADTVHRALAAALPEDPPRFMARVPHGYGDPRVITGALRLGGFEGVPEFTSRTAWSHADDPRIPAIALCQGTPLRNELEARAPTRLEALTGLATIALRDRFGPGPLQGRMQAYVVAVER